MYIILTVDMPVFPDLVKTCMALCTERMWEGEFQTKSSSCSSVILIPITAFYSLCTQNKKQVGIGTFDQQ